MSVIGYDHKVIMGNKPTWNGGELPGFDFPKIIEDLRNEVRWKNGEINSIVLLKNPSIKVLLTIMHEETEVKSYQENDSATFQVFEGSLKIHFKNNYYTINEGESLTIFEKLKYSFESIEETAFLLTLMI